jgi:histone H1/5
MAKSKRGKRKPVAKPIVTKKTMAKPSAQTTPRPGARKKRVLTQVAADKKVASVKKQGKKVGGAIAKKARAKKSVAKKPIAKKHIAKKPIAKKPIAKKVIAKKPIAKKPIAKKVIAKKPVAKKALANKPVAKKALVKKPVAKSPVAKKPIAKKAPAKNPVAEKALVNKPVAKKALAKKPVAKAAIVTKPVTPKPVAPPPAPSTIAPPSPEALFEFYQANVHGKNGKHELAMQALRLAAEEGFARAQYELSGYCKGEEKIAWLLLSAEAGGILAISTLERLARSAPEGAIDGKSAAEWRRLGIDQALHGNDGAGSRFMGGVLRSEAGRDKAMLTQALAMFDHGAELGDAEAKKSAVSLRRAIQIIDGSLADLVREIGPGLGLGLVELEKIASLVRPSKRGVAVNTATVVSRLGGVPNLPRGTAWPTHGTVPLSFIAEIDLGEAGLNALAPGVPAQGRLFFFVDDGGFFQGPSEAVACRVLYGDGLDGEEPPVPEGATTFHPVPLTFVSEETLPFGRTALAREAAGAAMKPYWELWENWQAARTPEFRDGRVHRLLGHADAIQGDMARRLVYDRAGRNVDEPSPELDRAAARLRLLLQVDSESSADMMWGDLGRIFFLIDEDDLAWGNFDRVSVVLQSG